MSLSIQVNSFRYIVCNRFEESNPFLIFISNLFKLFMKLAHRFRTKSVATQYRVVFVEKENS